MRDGAYGADESKSSGCGRSTHGSDRDVDLLTLLVAGAKDVTPLADDAAVAVVDRPA
jgi:hypothetical protein